MQLWEGRGEYWAGLDVLYAGVRDKEDACSCGCVRVAIISHVINRDFIKRSTVVIFLSEVLTCN